MDIYSKRYPDKASKDCSLTMNNPVIAINIALLVYK